jgi:hypothetical protein
MKTNKINVGSYPLTLILLRSTMMFVEWDKDGGRESLSTSEKVGDVVDIEQLPARSYTTSTSRFCRPICISKKLKAW